MKKIDLRPREVKLKIDKFKGPRIYRKLLKPLRKDLARRLYG